MIHVNDPYDLVPELFTAYTEFVKTSDAEVDILPATCNESFQCSDQPTIFIQPEPDIHHADTAYHQQIATKSNAAWAVSGHATTNNSSWKLKKWFSYYANLTMTVRVNPPMIELESRHKSWLATALLGGWSPYRGQLLKELRLLGILDQCLVNYHERTPEKIEFRNNLKQQNPTIYFNTRTPELDQLDNPTFLDIAFKNNPSDEWQSGSMNTCRPIPGMKPKQHGWISQLVPWKIYNSAYISIVAETEGTPDLFFISEKISRPLLVGHPFVVFGCAGYLAELQKLGFRTFSSWIDESYDTIQDSTQRAKAIANSVKQFADLSDQQKQYVCKEMKLATDHNRLLILDNKWSNRSLRDAILDLKKP
jgi:hypothetical protein